MPEVKIKRATSPKPIDSVTRGGHDGELETSWSNRSAKWRAGWIVEEREEVSLKQNSFGSPAKAPVVSMSSFKAVRNAETWYIFLTA